MYHLLVSYAGWAPGSDTLGRDRVFEYTEEAIANDLKPAGTIDIAKVSAYPALFIPEMGGDAPKIAQLGYINQVLINGRDYTLRYAFDANMPVIALDTIRNLANELFIQDFEFSRTHWAVKDVDIFRVLFTHQLEVLPRPEVFDIDGIAVEDDLVSVMMPFDNSCAGVYPALQGMSQQLGLRCLRADDIWDHNTIIQDIVSLICRSRIVVCDCTGKNPNVFYEAGIAHALGKSVVLITQSTDDVPFDLRHLRHLRYLNNDQGRDQLVVDLSQRIGTILRNGA